MRIRTVTGLAFAAAAVAAAVGLGTAAYADGQGETLIITTEESNRTGTVDTAAGGAAARWDCPESDGAGSSPSARSS
jgi:uncharacterized protein HemX